MWFEKMEGMKRNGWLKGVLGFGLASFLSDASHEAATAAMPAFLAMLGAAPVALGVIEGVADGLSSFAKLAGGGLANRPSWRKPLTVLGYLITGLSTGAYALATVWGHVFLARGAGWFAKGFRGPARDAMLADSVRDEDRGKAFGFHRAMDTLGAIVGPAGAAVLVSVSEVRSVFVWALIPGVLAALAIAVFTKPGVDEKAPPVPFWKSVRDLPSRFRVFLGAVFFFGMGDFARSLLILRATELLTPSMGATTAAALAMGLYVFHNAVYSALSFPVGWLADRVDPQRLLVIGYVIGVATAAMAALTGPSLVSLAVLFLLGGLTLAFEDTLEGVITSAEVPKAIRGTGFGVLASVNGVGDLVSSSLVGILWAATGPLVAFTVAAGLCLVGTVMLAVSGPARRNSPSA